MKPLPGQRAFEFVEPKPATGPEQTVLCPICGGRAQSHDDVFWCPRCRCGFKAERPRGGSR
jgi:transposase